MTQRAGKEEPLRRILLRCSFFPMGLSNSREYGFSKNSTNDVVRDGTMNKALCLVSTRMNLYPPKKKGMEAHAYNPSSSSSSVGRAWVRLETSRFLGLTGQVI